MSRNVLMMGPPGSGKGTQAAIVGERRALAHISTGDMLRAAVAAGTELGGRVKDIMERGDLVPDGLMLELVRERLRDPDAADGFLLDGFPRTVPQAEGLLQTLTEVGKRLDVVVLLEVDDEVIVARALGRGRNDDDEETIRHRLNVYRDQTGPVLDYLDGMIPIVPVDGVGGIEEITERIEFVLDAEHHDQEPA